MGRHRAILVAMVGLALAPLSQMVPAQAKAPVSQPRGQADPAIGPHVRDELRHKHDVLHFTPAHTAIQRRRIKALNTTGAGAGSDATVQLASTAGAGDGPISVVPAPLASDGPIIAQPAALISNGGALRREVLGFAPYWELSQNSNWNYSLLSTVAYFGLDLTGTGNWDTTTGGYSGWGSQDLANIINGAHGAGDRVVLVIKPSGSSTEDTICQIVNSPTNTQNAINNTIAAVASKSLDGVNVDFEGTSAPDPKTAPHCNGQNPQAAFTSFVGQLSSAVHSRLPGDLVSVDTYSGSASFDGGFFNIDTLQPVTDMFFIMAYDMSFANMNNQPGFNAPLNGWTYNDTTSVNQYMSKAPPYKILLGVPYYGYKWSTTGNTEFSTRQPGTGADSDTYAGILSDFGCAANESFSKAFDTTAESPWAEWFSPAAGQPDPCGANHGSWRQLYYDDATSLGAKYDLVNSAGILGTGMWALGYDGSSQDLWNEIQTKLTGPSTTYYFAEGFTGPGFNEALSLLMPGFSGLAQVDYYTQSGHLPTQQVYLKAGQVAVVNVNAAVGANQNVSARVTFPANGVAERTLHFNFGAWHGSTDEVGAPQPATEWDFAEGSTLSFFSEYLTLQNPNNASVSTTINYFTDSGAHPTRSLTLAPMSRTTIQVADPTLGVGPGYQGVSAQVLASAPIVAERPMYVNGFNFGNGVIRDGHDAFGANAPARTWNFAEGTTLAGFNEYLSLQNPGTMAATVTVTYQTDTGTVIPRTLVVQPQSRSTIPVWMGAASNGAGAGWGGISAKVTSDQPIVAERPMYIVRNFGFGWVGGATDAMGATAFNSTYEFAALSTMGPENDFLTIQNPDPTNAASVTVNYLTPTGRIVHTISVPANSRHTVATFLNNGEGIGTGHYPVGVVITSSIAILVEKPTYSANPNAYGATDTIGASPAA